MKYFLSILTIIIFSCCVFAQGYNVFSPDEFKNNNLSASEEKILFILDFSNSMTEELNGHRKVDLMLKTMSKILPSINPETWVGLRVYGHRMGLTQYDACKASCLSVPISQNSAGLIQTKLAKTRPHGMTPITYSLKKAVESDFLGFSGKKHIILLSDGGENCDESPCTWAMNLVKVRKDIRIDVIAFNISNEDDLDQLRCTALVTTGKFHTANTSAELERSLQKTISRNKRVDAKIIQNP